MASQSRRINLRNNKELNIEIDMTDVVWKNYAEIVHKQEKENTYTLFFF